MGHGADPRADAAAQQRAGGHTAQAEGHDRPRVVIVIIADRGDHDPQQRAQRPTRDHAGGGAPARAARGARPPLPDPDDLRQRRAQLDFALDGRQQQRVGHDAVRIAFDGPARREADVQQAPAIDGGQELAQVVRRLDQGSGREFIIAGAGDSQRARDQRGQQHPQYPTSRTRHQILPVEDKSPAVPCQPRNQFGGTFATRYTMGSRFLRHRRWACGWGVAVGG